jgi:hypothetical protein
MNLLFKPKEYKLEVENITLDNNDVITMIELFVKENLTQNGREVFYSHLDELMEKTPALDQIEMIKDALYQAVLGEVSAKVLSATLKDIEANPDNWKNVKA